MNIDIKDKSNIVRYLTINEIKQTILDVFEYTNGKINTLIRCTHIEIRDSLENDSKIHAYTYLNEIIFNLSSILYTLKNNDLYNTKEKQIGFVVKLVIHELSHIDQNKIDQSQRIIELNNKYNVLFFILTHKHQLENVVKSHIDLIRNYSLEIISKNNRYQKMTHREAYDYLNVIFLQKTGVLLNIYYSYTPDLNMTSLYSQINHILKEFKK